MFSAFLFISPAFSATLPSGYTELEYIESNGTQYIDSGIYPDKNTEIEMVVKTNGPGSQYIFGIESGTDGTYYVGQTYMGDTLGVNVGNVPRIKSSAVGYTDFHKVEIKNQSVIVDGTTLGSFASASNFSSMNNAQIFDAYGSSWAADTGSKIKYLKIWQSGTLVRDYIPAEHNGQTGMYDAVSGNFFTNAETHYTQLEYLKSSGTQYIEDTSLTTITTGAIEIKTKDLANGARFAGWASGPYNNNIVLATPWSIKNDLPFCYGGTWNDKTDNTLNIEAENVFRYEFQPGLQKLYANGDFSKQATYGASNASYTFRLFMTSGPTYTGSTTIYYCKVFNENDVLKRHYIPVRRNSDGAIGMYETTMRAFLTNAGTGNFIVGPDTNLFVNEFTAGPVVETYTELEYVDIDNDYIDTGLVLYTDNATNHYPNIHVTTMQIGLPSGDITAFCGARDTGSYGFLWNTRTDEAALVRGSWVEYFDGNSYRMSSTPLEINKKYSLDIVNRVAIIKNITDNVTIGTHTFNTSTKNTVRTVALNGFNGSSTVSTTSGKIRIYDFEVEGEAHMIPAKRDSDNAIGMYDTIRNKFYTTAGSGTITAGPAVAQPATVEIIWGGLAEPDASGTCTYGETFTAPSTAPTAPSGLKFLGWRPR